MMGAEEHQVVMVRNPAAASNLADESAELPNLTEHVPVTDELRNAASNDINDHEKQKA